MPPRFDADHLTLDLSVADLLDRQSARSLGFQNRGGYERLWLGQAIHSRYQEQKLADDGSYRREVWVRHTFSHRGWQVTVSGRIDGVRRDPDGALVVEEIKSVRRGARLSDTQRETYAQQAALYAWMLAAAGPVTDDPVAPMALPSKETAVRAEVVLIEIGSDVTERDEVTVDTRALDALVKRRVNTLLRAYTAARMEADRRREASERMVFPYPEMRPGQELIVDAVSTALEQEEHLLLEATTGIGKTISALYPALRYCLEHDKRLFVLTAKTLQQEMATQVLELLNQEEAFRSLRLRAKSKMCANGQVLCHEEYCPFAREYGAKLQSSGLLKELHDAYSYLDPDAIYDAARATEVCPFEVSLELAARVQVTVCDYNYAFDPYVSLTDFQRDADLSDVVLVVDEIHNLVDRGRGYYSPELSARDAFQAAERVGRGGESIHRRLAELAAKLGRLIEGAVAASFDSEIAGGPGRGPGGPDRAVEAFLPEEQLWRLRPQFDGAFVDYLEFQRQTRSFSPDDAFVDLYFTFLRFLNGLVVSDDAFSHLVERVGRDARLKILCKDPSRFLGAVVNRTHATVGLSATLSPPEFYRDLLGFDPHRTASVSVPNPFPAENRRVVIDPSIATTYRERPAFYPLIAERLADLAQTVPGNCLALFPSYAFLAEVAGEISRLGEPLGKRILVQQRSAGDAEREEILETLRGAMFGDVLLLAVAGGVFAEGVDYPGEMLKAVAVVGPCLPALTLEQKLLSDYYQERFERGFEYAFVVPGMTRVVQAAGRLIRSPEDTGVIALLDRRFLQRPYSLHLPADWLPDEADPSVLCAEPAEAAKNFFHGA
jgi:DNA excision repair protein ERCC-2